MSFSTIRKLFLASCVALILLTGFATELRAYSGLPHDLTELTIEELMQIEITSLGKKPQQIFDVAAPVFIINDEDIRRSGAATIPDLLRMVPGVEVSRINVNKWAVSARGFNGRFASKLLVLMDGRTVYSPLFSGVYWDVQDTLLEDIERIEVVRGPGGSLWGANAVNGIINIITKHAKDTQGALVLGGAGTEERASGGIRYGGKVGSLGFYRAYAKYFDRDDAVDFNVDPTGDHWDALRAGFRTDWEFAERNAFTVQGDIYHGEAGEELSIPLLRPPFNETIAEDSDMKGGNILARWQHQSSDASDFALQVYYDRAERTNRRLQDTQDTIDLDFQHRFKWGHKQEIMWGLGYRMNHDHLGSTSFFSFDPDSATSQLFSGFLQDEITLIEKRLFLTLGSKFEHNDFTGVEYQPTARALWSFHDKQSIWASVSRAVRTPNRIETDTRHSPSVIPGNPPTALFITGNEEIEAERVVAYELGYRATPANNLYVDVALFYNFYDHLRTLEPGGRFLDASSMPKHFVLPIAIGNLMGGESYGAEVAADWRVIDRWRLQAAYTFLQLNLKLNDESLDRYSEDAEEESPQHQFSLRSALDITPNLQLDLWLRYVDALPALDVPSYTTLDARIAWKPLNDVEISVVGQNLFQSSHAEWGADRDNHSPSEVERALYGKIAICF